MSELPRERAKCRICGRMERYLLRLDEPVDGDVDIHAVARSFDGRFTVKGIFLSQAARILGTERYEALAPSLDEPQAGGRYIAFADYPLRDIAIVSFAAARVRYPHVSEREAYRRYAQDDLQRFLASPLGRATRPLLRSPLEALLRFAWIIERSAPGAWQMTGEKLGPRRVRVHYGFIPSNEIYQAGNLEGIVMSYGETPTTEVTRDGESVTFIVSW